MEEEEVRALADGRIFTGRQAKELGLVDELGDLDAAEGLTAAAGGLASREDLYNLGELEFAKGDVDAAAGWYEKASAADASWEKPWFTLGLVALNKGDIEGAKEHFQKVVELAPDSEEGTQAQATLSALP